MESWARGQVTLTICFNKREGFVTDFKDINKTNFI